jgi:TIGR03009 family protein
MRYRWLSLLAVASAATLALAQQPPPPAAKLDPANNQMDAILVQWEKAMGAINTLHTKVTRRSVDKTFGAVEVCEGEAKYVKPNKASIWLQNAAKPQEFERMVCNGQLVYKWEPRLREIHLYELEKPKQGQVSDENFVSFMFGMKAGQAKERYQMALNQEPKFLTDPNYYYVDVLPKLAADQQEFKRARLVLVKATGLPAQIWFEAPNQNETCWDFSKMVTNIPIDLREFEQPTPPKDWQLKRAPQMQKPTVRSQN